MEFTYSPKQTDRLLLNLPSWAHLTANHFLGVGWLTAVKCPASYNGPGVHSIHYTTTSILFLNVKDVHNYNTGGSSTNYIQPRFGSKKGSNSFTCYTTKMWNLPKYKP